MFALLFCCTVCLLFLWVWWLCSLFNSVDFIRICLYGFCCLYYMLLYVCLSTIWLLLWICVLFVCLVFDVFGLGGLLVFVVLCGWMCWLFSFGYLVMRLWFGVDLFGCCVERWVIWIWLFWFCLFCLCF